MHVIINWGGKVGYNLNRIYNLATMMKNEGYTVAVFEKDAARYRWLEERLGDGVLYGEVVLNNHNHNVNNDKCSS